MSRTLLSLVVLAVSVAPASAEDFVVLNTGAFLDTFDTAGVKFKTAVIKGAEDLVSIDTRPSNGVLYALGRYRLYRLDATTGWASPVGPEFDRDGLFLAPDSLEFDAIDDVGLVFVHAPSAGTSAGKNQMLRIDPETGAILRSDPNARRGPLIEYAPGDPAAGGTLRTASLGARPGALFGVDLERRTLIRFGAADGPATTVGELGFASTAISGGLDVAADGTAYALTMDPHTNFTVVLHTVDLTTGAATPLLELPPRVPHDFAMAPTAPSRPTRELQVSKAVVRWLFIVERGGSLEVRGTLTAPATRWEGRPVQVSIARSNAPTRQTNREFTLDRRARARSGTDSFVLTRGRRRGTLKYALKLSQADLRELFIDATSPSGRIALNVDLLLDGTPYHAMFSLDYLARGVRGVATPAR